MRRNKKPLLVQYSFPPAARKKERKKERKRGRKRKDWKKPYGIILVIPQKTKFAHTKHELQMDARELEYDG